MRCDLDKKDKSFASKRLEQRQESKNRKKKQKRRLKRKRRLKKQKRLQKRRLRLAEAMVEEKEAQMIYIN